MNPMKTSPVALGDKSLSKLAGGYSEQTVATSPAGITASGVANF